MGPAPSVPRRGPVRRSDPARRNPDRTHHLPRSSHDHQPAQLTVLATPSTSHNRDQSPDRLSLPGRAPPDHTQSPASRLRIPAKPSPEMSLSSSENLPPPGFLRQKGSLQNCSHRGSSVDTPPFRAERNRTPAQQGKGGDSPPGGPLLTSGRPQLVCIGDARLAITKPVGSTAGLAGSQVCGACVRHLGGTPSLALTGDATGVEAENSTREGRIPLLQLGEMSTLRRTATTTSQQKTASR
jgi:hypothetical protein